MEDRYGHDHIHKYGVSIQGNDVHSVVRQDVEVLGEDLLLRDNELPDMHIQQSAPRCRGNGSTGRNNNLFGTVSRGETLCYVHLLLHLRGKNSLIFLWKKLRALKNQTVSKTRGLDFQGDKRELVSIKRGLLG